MRFDTLGDQYTPNLVALARRGLLLSNVYSATPSCTPARSALLTGLSPWYNGMLGYGDVAVQYNFEMPREMASLGYNAVAIGKNHYFNGNFMPNNTSLPPSHGWSAQLLYDGLGSGEAAGDPSGEFDTYDAWFATATGGKDPLATGKPLLDWNSWRAAPYVYDEALHPTAWVGAQARAFLANASARGPAAPPFFLKVSFHRPHSPYDPPARLLNSTPAAGLPPVRVGAPWDAAFAQPPCGPQNADAWCGAMPEAALTLARRGYRANIRFVDEQVGLILADLEALGLANDTWILFVSDHGDGQGDHHLFRKTYPWEASSHVPGFITWPPTVAAVAPRGSSSPLLGELRDIFPTVLDIAGRGDLAVGLNGSSWACLVTADPSGTACGPGSGGASGGGVSPQPWRSTLDLEHSLIFGPRIHWNAILGGPGTDVAGLKYIFFAADASEQLFNLTADPHEMADLAPDAAHAPALAALRAALVAQFEREGRGPRWVSPEGKLLPRAEGQVYSPNYPAWSPPQPPIPTPPCAPPHWPGGWFCTPPGDYYKSCGGPAGNLAPLTLQTVVRAQAWCCANASCAGFDWAPSAHNASEGSGFYKTNALCGLATGTPYKGCYKPGQVPGH